MAPITATFDQVTAVVTLGHEVGAELTRGALAEYYGRASLEDTAMTPRSLPFGAAHEVLLTFPPGDNGSDRDSDSNSNSNSNSGPFVLNYVPLPLETVGEVPVRYNCGNIVATVMVGILVNSERTAVTFDGTDVKDDVVCGRVTWTGSTPPGWWVRVRAGECCIRIDAHPPPATPANLLDLSR
jgi:hypothetical protein